MNEWGLLFRGENAKEHSSDNGNDMIIVEIDQFFAQALLKKYQSRKKWLIYPREFMKN